MIDWRHFGRLLLAGTEAAANKFFAMNPTYDLSAFGYTFELANHSPAFSLVLNSHAFFRKTREEYKKHTPAFTEDELRWSSGDFEYQALCMGDLAEQGVEWEREYIALHELACRDYESCVEVYGGLVTISCDTLAALAKRGAFGDWKKIDFNVAEYHDDRATIMKRHRRFLALIESPG